MATRNPMNQRYNGDGPSGQTRKSAASAKPKRKAADTVYISGKSGGKGKPAPKLSKEEQRIEREKSRIESNAIYSAATVIMNNDPGYKRYKKVWWGLLIVAIVLIIATYIIQIIYKTTNPVFLAGSMIAAYVPIVSAIILDFRKIRPVRKMARIKASSMTKKQLDALLEKEVLKNQVKKLKKEQKKASSTGGELSEEQQQKLAELEQKTADKPEEQSKEAEKEPVEEVKKDMSRINSYRRGSHK